MSSLLRGVVLGTQCVDEAIVRLASEAEARALAAGPPDVNLSPVPQRLRRPAMDLMGGTLYMQSRDGQYHAVGIVREINVEQRMIDVTTFDATARGYIKGLTEVSLSFGGRL